MAPVDSLWNLPGWLCHKRFLYRTYTPKNLSCRWHTGRLQSEPTGATLLVNAERQGTMQCISEGGKARVANYGENWQKADLQKAISRHAGSDATSWRTITGKTIYENPTSGRQVVVDDAGYFRIFHPRTFGSKAGDNLDMLGKLPSPARRVKGGAIKSVPLTGDDLKAYTHFLMD